MSTIHRCRGCDRSAPVRWWNELSTDAVLAASSLLLALGLVTIEMLNADVELGVNVDG